MKFAFIIMGAYDSKSDKAAIHDGDARIIGVSNMDEACAVARELYAVGVNCIELCGAFGEAGAKRVIQAVENKIPVGFITHLPEQDAIYRYAFAQSK